MIPPKERENVSPADLKIRLRKIMKYSIALVNRLQGERERERERERGNVVLTK